jgi:sugar lactone lactonase YvrE
VEPIPLDALSTTAHGVVRPEDLTVTPDGRVLASDAASAVAEILPSGGIRRIGKAGGEPNGICALADGSVLIANFASGALQRLDLDTGRVDTVVDRIGDDALGAVNYPLVDSHGAVWVSSSTRGDPAAAVLHATPDGFVFRVDSDGNARVVADGIPFANCMAFDAGEAHLYVCRSSLADVARFAVDGGELGPAERYGPALGGRRDDELGPDHAGAFGDPKVMRRWALTDGCGFDAEGNLWVTLMTANRIVAITPELRVVTVIDDPDGKVLVAPTSVVWAGDDLRDLYIGSLAADYVVKTRSPVAGSARP